MRIGVPCIGQIQCIRCGFTKWSHFWLRDVSATEVQHQCPTCNQNSSAFRVVRMPPEALWNRPAPVSPERFGYWLGILRREFPDHPWVSDFGAYWYPGELDAAHERQLEEAKQLGSRAGFAFRIENWSPDDERIRVTVLKAHGQYATYELDPLELQHGFTLADRDLRRIEECLAEMQGDIRAAWDRFGTVVALNRRKWLDRLGMS